MQRHVQRGAEAKRKAEDQSAQQRNSNARVRIPHSTAQLQYILTLDYEGLCGAVLVYGRVLWLRTEL